MYQYKEDAAGNPDLSGLSIRDKVLQTVVIKVNKDSFNQEKIGAAFFFGEIITEADEMGLDAARNTLKEYKDNAGIPILITSDFENGCGSMLKGLTPLPYLMSLGAANDETLAYDYGRATALEGRSVGANWSFSPVSDLNLNPRNPLVGVRSVGDDPACASRLLSAVIKGMQENGLAACAKHFPGDGVDYRDQHLVTTSNSLSMEEWKKTSGKVFQDLIDAGVYSIMPGHITLPAYQKERARNGLPLPATLSHELITELLKGEMGFDGVVVTDALDMGGFNGWYPTRLASQLASFKAGCDMMLWPCPEYVNAAVQAVESGEISMERLDDAVSRILKMKKKLGLFDRSDEARPLTQEERDFVKRTQQAVAEGSVTLIQDAEKLFPIDKARVKRIAVMPISHYAPAYAEATLLCEELKKQGFSVTDCRDMEWGRINDDVIDKHDMLLFAVFARSFRPIGFLDFHTTEAGKILHSLQYGAEKTAVVSFGAPYYGQQYFERAGAYVNAYSMLAPSVKAFVRAAVGEIPFGDYSPVKL